MKPFIKYGIIAAAWILFLALAVSGKGSTDALDANSSQPSDTSYNVSESLEPVSDNQSTEGTALYATDEVVNRFITEFNNNSAYEITDIRQDNILSSLKKACYINGFHRSSGAYYTTITPFAKEL